MYKEILIVLDGTRGSRHVVPWARRLARPGRATIRLLTVLPEVRDVERRGRQVVYVDQLESQAAAGARAALDPMAASLEQEGFQVVREVRFGEPAATILETAHSAGAEVIAIAMQRPQGIRGRWTDSLAEDVLRRSPVAVFVTRPGQAAA